MKLLLVPGIVEAFFDGAIAMPIFGMPPTFAFALGFILKAVGPALVIQAMFEVQQKRLGSTKREASPTTRASLSLFKSGGSFGQDRVLWTIASPLSCQAICISLACCTRLL